jgi:malonate-semialdehyde dehydrogenase (acetylating)/methylmalonate-semialdehyde dehydrogenase
MNTISTKYPPAKNFIGGMFLDASGTVFPVINPSDGSVLSEVVLSERSSLDTAVAAAKKAFPHWSALTIKERTQVFYKFRALLEEHLEELSELVRLENGKTFEEAKAEVLKGMELSEFACSLPTLLNDEIQEVSKGVECRTTHVPVGIVASIVPFNFPLMVPLWTLPNAIALGNCMILKPSELVPLSSQRIAMLLQESGLPDGVFNIVNGGREMVEAICDHPEIAAVTFVGSTKVAKIVYKRATSNLKRCLALGGAKNHLIVLEDANPEISAANIAASMSGCAGQRCMAAAAVVGVGDIDHIVHQICEESIKIIPGKNLGAVISPEAKARIEDYISEAEAAGARILVDGRNASVPGKESGFYVGPTVIDNVTPDMSIAKEEVFGPVLVIIRAKDVDEAIRIENESPYGNASSVFTESGGMANYVMERVSAGMVGVNIGVPVPREPFSFGGWNESRFGVGDITGKSSIGFWTKLKKRTTKWDPKAWKDWAS